MTKDNRQLLRIYPLFVLFFFCPCFKLLSGERASTINPKKIFALGLTYKEHIKETGEPVEDSVDPPVFKKLEKSFLSVGALNLSQLVMPTKEALLESLLGVDVDPLHLIPSLGSEIPVLLDYETELGIALKKNICRDELNSSDFIRLVLFLTNDFSSRSIQVLGEGQSNKYEFWTASKSFSSFLPVGRELERTISLDSWPQNLALKTFVNSELRQHSQVSDIIYSPRQMLNFVMNYSGVECLEKGTAIMTGTPSGVIFKVGKFKRLMAKLFMMDRLEKLNLVAKKRERYLKSGDVVKSVLLDNQPYSNLEHVVDYFEIKIK